MTVGIVGLGLIGGSFAKAYHETGARVLACNRSRDVLDFAVMSGAVDGELTEECRNYRPGEYGGKLILPHKPNGDLAGRAGMVSVNGAAAHPVGDGERAAGGEKPGEPVYKPLRLREVRKGVVDHDAVIIPVKRRLLHVAADETDFVGRKLPGGYPYHLGRDIYPRDGGHAARKVIRHEHARAAGHVQNARARAHIGIVKDRGNDRVIAYHLRVPVGRMSVEKLYYILLIHCLHPRLLLFSRAAPLTARRSASRTAPRTPAAPQSRRRKAFPASSQRVGHPCGSRAPPWRATTRPRA